MTRAPLVQPAPNNAGARQLFDVTQLAVRMRDRLGKTPGCGEAPEAYR